MNRLPLVIIFSTRPQSGKHLDQAIVAEAEADRQQLDRAIGVDRPHMRGLPLVDYRAERNRRRRGVLANDNLHHREHLRAEKSVRVRYLSSHHPPAARRVDGRVDVLDLRLEHSSRLREDAEFDGLPNLDLVGIRLAHESGKPHGRQIANHQNGIARARSDVLSWPDFALNHSTRKGREDLRLGRDRHRVLECINFGIRLADDAQAASMGLECRLGALQIKPGRGEVGLSLLPFP